MATEPTGYSFSQNGTKFKFAARTTGSTSGRPINSTSFPRDCSLRANAVMGFRCPVTGILTKPSFILVLPTDPISGLTSLLNEPSRQRCCRLVQLFIREAFIRRLQPSCVDSEQLKCLPDLLNSSPTFLGDMTRVTTKYSRGGNLVCK